MKNFLVRISKSPWFFLGVGAFEFIFGLIASWLAMVGLFLVFGIFSVVVKAKELSEPDVSSEEFIKGK
jgi:hypothetical protein